MKSELACKFGDDVVYFDEFYDNKVELYIICFESEHLKSNFLEFNFFSFCHKLWQMYWCITLVQSGSHWFQVDHTDLQQIRLIQTKINWSKSNHTNSNQIKLIQPKSNWSKANPTRNKLIQVESNWSKSDQIDPNRLSVILFEVV